MAVVVQMLLLGKFAKVAGQGEVIVFDLIESLDVPGVVRLQQCVAQPDDRLLISGMRICRLSILSNCGCGSNQKEISVHFMAITLLLPGIPGGNTAERLLLIQATSSPGSIWSTKHHIQVSPGSIERTKGCLVL
jgi:hypothetical protein